jgi:hypothetical protein
MRPTDWTRASLDVPPHRECRKSPRGAAGEPERRYILSLVLGTFQEMQGMRLSLAEAGRMFGLRETTCRVVLDCLVGQNRLRVTDDGRYTLA